VKQQQLLQWQSKNRVFIREFIHMLQYNSVEINQLISLMFYCKILKVNLIYFHEKNLSINHSVRLHIEQVDTIA
jgi:hypothetical protein